MTNEEWIVEKWEKFTKWYAKRVWWFVLLFVAVVTTVLTIGAKTDNNTLIISGSLLMPLFSACTGCGIANWLELEHKEAGK